MKKITQFFLSVVVLIITVSAPSYAKTVLPGDSTKVITYPNPVVDQMTIILDKATPDATVQIFALNGEELYRAKFGNGIIFFNNQEDKYPARSAMYIVRITSQDGKQVEVAKFIKFRT
jgi:hypothetical protein